MGIIKQLFCKHQNKICITNIHGDWRNHIDACSVLECKDCKKRFLSDILDPNCKTINFWIKIKEDT